MGDKPFDDFVHRDDGTITVQARKIYEPKYEVQTMGHMLIMDLETFENNYVRYKPPVDGRKDN